jgi:Cys-tRNA(Pro)/Cys-tRNA(Cys) deacylase
MREKQPSSSGVDPAQVHKTLIAVAAGQLVVAIVPSDALVDLKQLAIALGVKRAEMADPADAQRTTGYVLGGISPLGQRKRLPTVLDADALTHPTVLVSAGRRGLEIELAPTDLLRLTAGVVAPIARRN